jgi:hypothetical protein
MKWLLENGFEHGSEIFAAAKNDNLNNMRWLLENDFKHDSNTFYKIILNDNVNNMKMIIRE